VRSIEDFEKILVIAQEALQCNGNQVLCGELGNHYLRLKKELEELTLIKNAKEL
jgi:hypothetical protein